MARGRHGRAGKKQSHEQGRHQGQRQRPKF
jgi:hypothetical protein